MPKCIAGTSLSASTPPTSLSATPGFKPATSLLLSLATAASKGPLSASLTNDRLRSGLTTLAAADSGADAVVTGTGEELASDKLIKDANESSLSTETDATAVAVSPRVLQSVLIACLGAFAFGYHISVVNGPLPYILADIGGTGSSLVGGWIVSISLASAAAGALLGGLLADSLGRRRTLMFVSLPFIFGSALSALASNIPQMLIGRAIVGASFGIVSSVVPLYISEVSPPSVRGAYGSFNQLTICIGTDSSLQVTARECMQMAGLAMSVACWKAALFAGVPLAYFASWWRLMFWIRAHVCG